MAAPQHSLAGHQPQSSSSSLASSSSAVSNDLDTSPTPVRMRLIGGGDSNALTETLKGLSQMDKLDIPTGQGKHRPSGLPLSSMNSTPTYRSILDRPGGDAAMDHEQINPYFENHPDFLHASTSSSASSNMDEDSRIGVNPNAPPHSPLTEQLFLANETVEHLASCLTGLARRKAERERRVEASSLSLAAGGATGGGSAASLRELEMVVEARAGSAEGLGIEGGEGFANGTAEVGWICCCDTGAFAGQDGRCHSREWRVQLEAELRLSGEIGQALLARYSALLAKHDATSTRLEEQSELLARAYKKEAGLDKALELQMRKWKEVLERNEALERQYTQAQHSMTLSSTTVLALRQELSSTKTSRSHAKTQSASLESTLMELKRLEVSLREDLEVEKRGRKEEERKRRLAERRAEELERRVTALIGEVQAGRSARERDGKELLANAEETMGALLNEPANEEDPDVQRALGDMVAANTLLRHAVAEMKIQLADSWERTRALEREVDDLRVGLGVAPRTPLESEIHNGPDSSGSEHGSAGVVKPSPAEAKRRKRHSIAVMAPPIKNGFVPRQLSLSIQSNASSAGHGRHQSLTPSLAASVASSSNRYGFAHDRTDSLTPSMASNALSPRSSMAVAGLGPAYQPEQSHSPIPDGSEAAQSPRLAPPSHFGRIRLPGVQRPQSISHPHRSFSMDRPPGPARGLSGVNSIGEDSEEAIEPMPSSPVALDSLAGSSSRRKRTSFLGSSSRRRNAHSPVAEQSLDPVSAPASASMSGVQHASGLDLSKTIGRRPLTLVPTASKAVQTEEAEEPTLPTLHRLRTLSEKPSQSSLHSEGSRPSLRGLGLENEDILSSRGSVPILGDSIGSPQHDARTAGLPVLIDQMARLLVKLRQSDVANLSSRLKRQHLTGDVGHLSTSTMRSLNAEIADMKLFFRAALEEEKRSRHRVPNQESALTRKDTASLLKLFKELFAELVALRTTVNQVTLEPSSAHKLAALGAAQLDEDKTRHGGSKEPAPTGALGWIGPISKLFAVAPVEAARSSPSEPQAAHPVQSRSAPKLMASTSATTTHINVEFAGGAGIVRRSTVETSAQHDDVAATLPDSPSDSITKYASIAIRHPSTRPSPQITLGGGSTRGPPSSYKPALMGIFAGASGRSGATQGLQGAPGDFGTSKRLRTQTSQTLRPERDPAAFVRGKMHKRQLSSAVDAVIDTALPEHMIGMGAHIDEEPILQRTLRGRPRGLSDSSIRSTFVSHAGSVTANMDHSENAQSALAPVPATSRTTTIQTADGEGPISGSTVGVATYWPRSNSMMRKLGRGLGVIPPKASSGSSSLKEREESPDRASPSVTAIDAPLGSPHSALPETGPGHAKTRTPSATRDKMPPRVIRSKPSQANARAAFAAGSAGGAGSYLGTSAAARSSGSADLDEAMDRNRGRPTVGKGILGMFAGSENVFDEDGNMSRRFV